MPIGLILFGFYGARLLVACGLLAFIVPLPHSFGHGGFFLLLRSEAAGLDSVMRTIALPGILTGVALIGLPELRPHVQRLAIVGQTVIGAQAILFLAVVILNVMILLLIIAAFIFAIAALIAGPASA